MLGHLFFKSILNTKCMKINLNSRTIISLCSLHSSKWKCTAHNRFLHSREIHNTDSKCNVRPPRRALLYVPAHDIRKIEKIRNLGADLVVLDCEDGVEMEKKDHALSNILELYNRIEIEFVGELGIRVNSPSSGLLERDITGIFTMKCLPTTIVVPKINEAKDLKTFYGLLNGNFDKAFHVPQKQSLRIIFMTETARGLINLKEIIETGIKESSSSVLDAKISGVIFGSDDFCADVGITRSHDSTQLLYARQKIITTAKAFNLDAIDMVYIDYKDNNGLRKQAIEGANMGFNGKQIIHPNQIPIVHECFFPSQDKITWAQNLLEAYNESKEGVFTFEGQMIDMPTILQAQNIMDQVKIIRKKKY